MAVETVAAAHYQRQTTLARRAADEVGRLWGQVDRSAIAASWLALIEAVLAVQSSAQTIAAASSGIYVGDVVKELGGADDPFGSVAPAAFAGIASDGRELESLLYQPAITALDLIGRGVTVDRAMAAAAVELDMIVRTQVADAGRTADGVAITARPALTGYVRMLVPPSCSRCIILAGVVYQWNDGFERHPRCDCRHIPADEDVANDLTTDPTAAFESMTEAEQDKAFTKAGAQAIREGADMARVVNARRGMYTAGGEKLTTEGTSKQRGRVRLMPEAIYQQAGDDRAEAVRLLRQHGYLIGKAQPRRAARRDPLDGIDVANLPDGDLFALWARHADDPAAADRIGAEFDRRDEERGDLGADVEPDVAADTDEDAAETLAALDADLAAQVEANAERDAEEREAAEQAARELQIDQLIARGWEYREAYAEVYNLDADELLRQERQAAVDADRRAGETREQAVRRQYGEWVRLQYLDAESGTRGHMLTREAVSKGIDPLDLFSGPAHIARAYASEDLKVWWAANGGRRTYIEFRAEVLGRASDIAEAERIRGRGNDRDFAL